MKKISYKGFSFLGILCVFLILGFSSASGQSTVLVFSPEVVAEGDNLPNRARVAWSGMYDIDDQWRVVGNSLTGYEIGPEFKHTVKPGNTTNRRCIVWPIPCGFRY